MDIRRSVRKRRTFRAATSFALTAMRHFKVTIGSFDKTVGGSS
jgi:hypothetical protein